MRLGPKDLCHLGKLIRDMTNGRFKLGLIDTQKSKLVLDFEKEPEEGFEEMAQQTTLACINQILNPKALEPPKKEKEKKTINPCGNKYLWDQYKDNKH